jgi:hypothetical protein
MFSAKKQRSVLSLYVALTIAMAQVIVAHSFAADDFKVSIGSSSWNASEASSHNITRDALESGQNNFAVSTSGGDTFQINLSEKQIKDILAGSTVTVNTESGDQKVMIGPKHKEPVKSGW